MVIGRPPFGKASRSEDLKFAKIYTNNWEEFWQDSIHEGYYENTEITS